MENCLFCKIAAGEIPADKVLETEHLLAFKDIHPQAPTHILIIPKEHFATLNDVPPEKMDIISKIFATVPQLAKQAGCAENGYRVLVNTNRDSGQIIFHLHFHLIGGRKLGRIG